MNAAVWDGWWTCGSGLIELHFTEEEARMVPLSGRADDGVAALSRVPGIAEKVAALDPALVAKELREYGAWDDEELRDHEQNIQRLLWIAASDVQEENNRNK